MCKVFYLRKKKANMKYCCLIGILAFLAACGSGEQHQHTPTIPGACEMLTLKQLKDILREPVEGPVATNANAGERSACTFTMPGRAAGNQLVIYILQSNAGKDPLRFGALAAEWQARFMGAEYEMEAVSGYPMVFFPGERNVYPPTFLISFRQVDLAIQGAAKDDAKSIAFRAMVQYQWK